MPGENQPQIAPPRPGASPSSAVERAAKMHRKQGQRALALEAGSRLHGPVREPDKLQYIFQVKSDKISLIGKVVLVFFIERLQDGFFLLELVDEDVCFV